jgi:hypothetical protein
VGSDEIIVTLDNEVIAPTIIDTTVTPDTVTAGEFDDVLFTIELSDPESAMESVEIDLSPLGGSSDQTMYDDGTRGDEFAGDNIYSYETTISSFVTPGEKSLTITVTYREGDPLKTLVELTVFEPLDGGDGGSDGGDGSDGSGDDGSDGSDDGGGSSATKDEGEEIPWLFVLLIPILGIIIVSLVYVASRRNRAKNIKQAQPVQQYQPGYYQVPSGYGQVPPYQQYK